MIQYFGVFFPDQNLLGIEIIEIDSELTDPSYSESCGTYYIVEIRDVT